MYDRWRDRGRPLAPHMDRRSASCAWSRSVVSADPPFQDGQIPGCYGLYECDALSRFDAPAVACLLLRCLSQVLLSNSG